MIEKIKILLILSMFVFLLNACSQPKDKLEEEKQLTISQPTYSTQNLETISELTPEQQAAFDAFNTLQVSTDEAMLDILIKAGNDINAQIENPEIKGNAKGEVKETGNTQLDYTPLMLAIGITSGSASAGAPGKHHIAELLIKKGADVTKKAAAFDATAISLAACQPNANLLKMIIEKGGNLEDEIWIIDNQTGLYMKGATPLILAAKYNQLENCKVLIEAGAKITKGAEGVGKTDKGCFYKIKDKSGLYYAIETGNEALVQLFLDNHNMWNNHTMEYIQPDQTSKQQFGNYVLVDNTCSKTRGPIRPGMHANDVGQKAIAKQLAKKGL